MAVLVSNGPTSLSTVNGWYRAEAFNLACFGGNVSLSTTRTIPVTFANAGACQGVILCISSVTALSAHTKTLTVDLQEFVAGSWTTRASVTYDKTAMFNMGSAGTAVDEFIPFTGGTFPYAVTTAANTWRFQISQSAGSFDWLLRTSDNTNPFFVTWCNNALTFASGADAIVCKDKVTLDMTATLKGVLGTGDTTRSVCAVLCRTMDPTPANVARFEWQNPPAAAYTLTIDGAFVVGAHSGVRVGTAAAPIPFAQQATIQTVPATSGTAVNSGFRVPGGNISKSSYFFFGEYPPVMSAALAADASTGQPNIVTTASTGWAAGDRLMIGGCVNSGSGDSTVYSVLSTTGPTVTLATNLATQNRKVNGRVVKLNGYGVALLGSATAALFHQVGTLNFQLQGCQIQYTRFSGLDNYVPDLPENAEACFVKRCCGEQAPTQPESGFGRIFDLFGARDYPFDIVDNVFASSNLGGFIAVNAAPNPPLMTIARNICVRMSHFGNGSVQTSAGWYGVFSDNVLENAAASLLQFSGVNCTVANNRFWGGQSLGALWFQGAINCVFSGNSYNNSSRAIQFQAGSVVNCIDIASSFGTELVNNGDISFNTGVLASYTMIAPAGNLSGELLNSNSLFYANAPASSHIRITDVGGTVGNDQGLLKFGNYQKTGAGLADTTARTAGGFALRLACRNATRPIEWPNLVSERGVPTGNIQGKTMTVTAWVYINNAAYYAGTHTKPTLNVKYDNATQATAVAGATAGSWQQLAVTFTPTTTFGQIEVWFSGATSATGANSYFYVDDVQVAYPAGVAINLGGLDLWANATPIWPPIATFPALGGVLDEVLAAHTVPGTLGALLNAPVPADVRAVNGLTVDGTGTESDPWGPA